MFIVFKNTTSKTDEELLADYRETLDMAAFGALYDRYLTLLYGVCLKYLKNQADAKDEVMQIFSDVSAKVLSHDVKLFKPWLYVVAKNHCLMRLRKEAKNKAVVFEEKFMDFTEAFHLDKIMEDERRMRGLQECIDALPPHQKAAVTKFFMEELSYKEVSEAIGNDLNKVKSFIQNGKRNLKICLENKKIVS